MSGQKKRKIEYSSDPNKWMEWYNLLSSDESGGDDESDRDEEDHIEEEIDDSNSEQEGSDTDEQLQKHEEDKERLCFLAKDGTTKWMKHPQRPANVRTLSCNIITDLPGPKSKACETQNEIDIFNLFFDDTIFEIIMNSTNIFIDKIREKFTRERDARYTDILELKAFVGLLFLIGALRCSKKNLSDLWNNSTGNGLESCYLSMSEKRFRFLLRCLRFDNVNDRDERRETDKLAPFREVMTIFINNCQKYYTPGEFLTVDEQLVGFRGRCCFRQYIPSKPAKYGLKVFALVDSKTAYTINMEPHVGTQPNGPYQVGNSAEEVVLRLVKPVQGSNRNITGDNWFTSLSLVNKLKEKKLTYVGTIRKNRKEIPIELLPSKQRKLHSSIFGYQKDCTIVSYCTKPSAAVLLLSSMHLDDTIDTSTGEQQKPAIVTFYNATKVGVDLVDQLCERNNTARSTRRWPMVLFYDILNIAAINSLCVYSYHSAATGKHVRRVDFLKTLSWELIKPQIVHRSTIETLPREIRRRARLLVHTPEPELQEPPGPSSRGRCYACGRKRDRTTRKWCVKCCKWMCIDHLKNICAECVEN